MLSKGELATGQKAGRHCQSPALWVHVTSGRPKVGEGFPHGQWRCLCLHPTAVLCLVSHSARDGGCRCHAVADAAVLGASRWRAPLPGTPRGTPCPAWPPPPGCPSGRGGSALCACAPAARMDPVQPANAAQLLGAHPGVCPHSAWQRRQTRARCARERQQRGHAAAACGGGGRRASGQRRGCCASSSSQACSRD